MPAPPDTPTRAVCLGGQLLFGDQWQVPLARALDVNERTMRRLVEADREGRDYPAARGVVVQLAAYMRKRADQLGGLADDFARRWPD